MENELGIYIVKKFEKLDTRRSTWKTHWEQVAEYIVPKKDDVYGSAIIGEEKYNLLYDSTAINANDMLASMLHSTLTSALSKWYELTTGDRELDANDNVRMYRQQAADVMMEVLNQSNFQSQIHEVYVDLGSFGTGVLRIEEDDKTVIRFTSRPIYEVCIAENYQNEVDTAYYEYKMTLEQIVEQFGEDKLSQELTEKYAAEPMHEECVIHAVEPRKRSKMLEGKRGQGMPFSSVHVLKRTKEVLKESGYKEFPYVIPRWSKLSSEIYGRSQGMKALPDTRMINKESKAQIEASQLNIAPPVQVPDDNFILPVDLSPLGINYFRAGSKDRIETINLGANYRAGVDVLNRLEKKIEKVFFVDQMRLVENDRMTAVEVTQRRDENLRIIGPQGSRLENEMLKPLIERLFNICQRRGLLPEPPKELEGRPLQIRFKSLVAKAQRAVEAEAFGRTLQMIMPLAEAKPEMLDYLNGDEVLKHGAEIFSLYYKLLNNDADVAKIRKQRQQMQMQQMQQQQEQHTAEVASKTPKES